MFTIASETKPTPNYQTEYISSTAAGTGGIGWDYEPPTTPCNPPWGSYGGCPYRLPCERCRKTGQMCPVNGGYYVTGC